MTKTLTKANAAKVADVSVRALQGAARDLEVGDLEAAVQMMYADVVNRNYESALGWATYIRRCVGNPAHVVALDGLIESLKTLIEVSE